MPPCNENLRHIYRVWQLVKDDLTVAKFCDRDFKMYGFETSRAMNRALRQRIAKQWHLEDRARFEAKPKGYRTTKGIRYRFREPEKVEVIKEVVKEVVKVVKIVEKQPEGMKLLKLKLKYGLRG